MEVVQFIGVVCAAPLLAALLVPIWFVSGALQGALSRHDVLEALVKQVEDRIEAQGFELSGDDLNRLSTLRQDVANEPTPSGVPRQAAAAQDVLVALLSAGADRENWPDVRRHVTAISDAARTKLRGESLRRLENDLSGESATLILEHAAKWRSRTDRWARWVACKILVPRALKHVVNRFGLAVTGWSIAGLAASLLVWLILSAVLNREGQTHQDFFVYLSGGVTWGALLGFAVADIEFGRLLDAQVPPDRKRRWRVGAATILLAMIGLFALAQRGRPASAANPAMQPDPTPLGVTQAFLVLLLTTAVIGLAWSGYRKLMHRGGPSYEQDQGWAQMFFSAFFLLFGLIVLLPAANITTSAWVGLPLMLAALGCAMRGWFLETRAKLKRRSAP